MATRRNITNGPSMLDLMLALFDGDSQHRRPLHFTLVFADEHTASESQSEPIVINSVSREDGSGKNWLIQGWTITVDGPRSVDGFYNTEKRRGWIEFISNPFPAKHPRLKNGTRVVTTLENTAIARNWKFDESQRRWGVPGVIVNQLDVAGFDYEVLHEDGARGHYFRDEVKLAE
jgi:hypothetical protein